MNTNQSPEDLAARIAELDRENSELKRMLNTNPDTGLPIRRVGEQRLRDILQDPPAVVGVLLLRLDGDYERIRGTRDAGRALLVKTILRLRRVLGEHIFQSDRQDEFLCLLTSAERGDSFRATLNAAIQAVAQPHEPPAEDVAFGCRIGVSISDSLGLSAEELLWQAALSLNEAVRGNQPLLYYSHELGARTRARHELEEDLRRQLRSGFDNFYVVYQPIVAEDGVIVGGEVLARWRHPERGLIPPDVFIPMAEANGLIRHIGQWTLYQAVRGLQRLRELGFTGYFSVNISPVQFHQVDMVSRVQKILDGSGLPGESLQLELTEGALLQNTESVVSKVAALRKLKIRFAIDDFGTGYSSLKYLQNFPVDVIKIDKSFVLGISDHPSRREILRTILFMAHSLGVKAMAEGVETPRERDALLAEQCDTMQGYYFSPPVDIGRFSQFISSGGRLPS